MKRKERTIGIGIDFGTSNSAAAWFDGESVHLINVEAGNTFVPTALHMDREFRTRTGTDAIRQYVEENRARRVELTARVVGEAAYDVREIIGDSPLDPTSGEKQAVYGLAEDQGMPGRLFLGIKRLLGQAGLKRVIIFEQPFRLVALVTPILVSLREAIDRVLPGRTDAIHMGRPVIFEGEEADSNAVATARLREAGGYAGFTDVTFYPEPVAACLSFVHQRNIDRQGLILTIDFGGGTLDLSLVRYRHNDFDVLDTAGAPIGGDRIDQEIYRKMVFPELGQGIQWPRRGESGQVSTSPFPFHIYERALLNWTITHTLNQNEYLTRLGEYIAEQGPHVDRIRRLRDLIQHNYGYNVIQAIKRAKAELSERQSTVIEIPELDLTIPFDRNQLDAILVDVLDTLKQLIDALLARNGVAAQDVDYLVRTGGSSQIIAVVDLLDSLFPGKVVEHDPFTSVASGLAIADYYGYQWSDTVPG